MATIPLMGQGVKLPDFNMGDTFVNIARLKAYEQNQRLEELKLGQTQRTLDREDLWRQVWGDVMTPSQPVAGTRGLAGAPPGGATAPPPGGVPPTPGAAPPLTMAQHVPPATQGTYANTGMPRGAPASGMPTEFGTAPIDLQSRAGLGGLAGMPPAGQPPAANVGMSIAPAPPPGMPPAAGPMPAQPPPGPPQPPADQGLGAKQPGLPDMPGLMLNFNQDALRRAYAIDPERTMKAYNDQVEMHGKKLEQAEKQNELVYNTLSALEQSPNPSAMYPMALQALRDKGVTVPASFPQEYDPALVRFKIREHEGMKERLNNAKVQLYSYQGQQAQTQAQENVAKQRKVEEETKLLGPEYELKRQDKLSEIQRRLEQTTDDREKRTLEAERNMMEALKVDQTKGNNTRSAEANMLAHTDKVFTDYRSVVNAWGRITAAGQKPTAAGDYALIYAFNKMLDEKTGVRNEEVKNAATLGGWSDKIKTWLNRAANGKMLDENIRTDMMARSKMLYDNYTRDYGDQVQQYKDIAVRQGLNPDNIVLDARSTVPDARKDTAAPPSSGSTGTGQPPAQRAPFDKADFMKWRGNKTTAPTQAEVEEYLKAKGGRAG